MTGSDMVYSFQQLLESISAKYKESEMLNTWEILSYINRTVERYIKLKYLSGSSFEENVFRASASPDDFAKLIKTKLCLVVPTTDIAVSITTGYLVDEIPDFFAYIRSDTKVTRTAPFVVTGEWVPNREIDYNSIDPVLTTPFNKPILEYPLVTMRLGTQSQDDGALGHLTTILIITDSFTTLELGSPSFNLTYISKPTPIDMDGKDCQLGPHLHEEIVKMAVSMYMDEYRLKLARTE